MYLVNNQKQCKSDVMVFNEVIVSGEGRGDGRVDQQLQIPKINIGSHCTYTVEMKAPILVVADSINKD